jgi:hypothetical protein
LSSIRTEYRFVITTKVQIDKLRKSGRELQGAQVSPEFVDAPMFKWISVCRHFGLLVLEFCAANFFDIELFD